MSRIIILKKKHKIILLITILALIGAVYVVARKKPLPPSDFQEEKTATGIAIPDESAARVSFDDKTKFVKKSAPQVVSPGAKFITVVEGTASAEDIISGATVVVYSSDNIKGDSEFLAERVVIIDNF